MFANAQTGNIVLLSSNLMDGNWERVLHYLVPLCAFALGVLTAEKMQEHFRNMQRLHWRQLVVLGEVLLLFLVGFLPQEQNLLANAIVSFSCAMQVQAFRKVNGYAFASTMCIGDLRSGVEALCVWSRTREPKAKDRMLRYFGIILRRGQLHRICCSCPLLLCKNHIAAMCRILFTHPLSARIISTAIERCKRESNVYQVVL